MNIELRWVERWPKDMPAEANINPPTQWRKERVLQYRTMCYAPAKGDARSASSIRYDLVWSDWRDVPVVKEEG